VGIDRRYPTAGSRNESSDSSKESGAGKSYPADGCGALRRPEYPLERARVRGSADSARGALVFDWSGDYSALCAAGTEEFYRLAGAQGHHRVHSKNGG